MPKIPKSFFVIKLFSGLVMFFALVPSIAKAEFVTTPNSGTLVTNATITSIIATSTATYIGGSFTYIGPYSGYAAPFATSTGTASTTYPQVNGTVSAIVSDRVGGWYIGGTFTQVGSTTVSKLAHILANGTVDTNFLPSMGNTVNALALSVDGLTLFVGGTFTTIGGVTYNRLAGITTSNGTASTTFNPNMGNSVNAVVVSPDGTTVYAGGVFTTVAGVTYNRLAGITISNGTASTTFNPNMSSTVNALAISSDGTKIYAGGSFTTVNTSTTRNRLAGFTTSNGTAISAFNPNMGNTVSSLALSSDDTKIYAGGTFQSVGGVTYNKVAGITTSNGTAIAAFNPSVVGTLASTATITALALSADATKLYIGGIYTSVGGTAYSGFNRITTSNGAVDTTFLPNAGGLLSALALSADGNTIYAGGTFLSIGGSIRNRLAAVDTTGQTVTSFDPNISGNGNGFIVNAIALSADGTKIYAGGSFTTVGGAAYQNFVGVTISTSAAIPSTSLSVSSTVNTLLLSPDGTRLYLGGAFTAINSVTYNRLAAISTSDSSSISAFNPNLSGGDVNALAISSDGATIYAGGSFTTVGVATYNRLAAITTSNGAAISAFNPNMGGTVNSLALSSGATTVYAGGGFSTVGGVTYNKLAAITTSNGAAISAFNPNLDSTVSSLALSSDGTKIYAGGSFSTVGGTSYTGLIGITTSNGAAISAFSPNMTANSSVNTLMLSADSSKLYAGGTFTNASSTVSAIRFSIFSTASTTLSKTTATATEGGAGDSYTIALAAPPWSNVTITPTPDAYLSVSPATLTFSTTSWATPQTVTISAPSNLIVEGTHSGTITHTVSSADGSYNGLSVPSIAVTITDSSSHIPTVTTQDATSIVSSGAVFNGTIVADGEASSTVRGFTYGLTTAYGATTTESGTFGTGTFSSTLTGLTANSVYHYRAYATNTSGIGYGGDLTATTTEAAAVATSEQTYSSGSSASSQVSNLISIGLYDQARIIAGRYGLSLSLPATLVPTSPQSVGVFNRSLSVGSEGDDVRSLQVFLNTHGFVLAKIGPGSLGHETSYFGALTRAAVIRFQKANKITPAIGYFGPITRTFINPK